MSQTPTTSTTLARAAVTVVFLGLTLALMVGFLQVFQPKAPLDQSAIFTAYSSEAMRDAVRPDVVQANLESVLRCGNRYLGDEGFYATEQLIRRAYEAAGLTVYEQENETVAPRTLERVILDAKGQPLAGVEIYPLAPNQLQPMVTPAGGLTGRLVLMTDEVLRSRERFDDCIALIDVEDPPKFYEFSWDRYAQLGVRAVIVAHRQGLNSMATAAVNSIATGMVGADPINYVRLVATEGIFKHLDQPITLRVRTEYRRTPHRTIVGVLKATRPAAEALVVGASYDAYSLLPDKSPGVLQAHGLAVQLALVKGLLPYRESLRRDVYFVSYGGRMMAQDGENRFLMAIGPQTGRAETRVNLERLRSENREQEGRIEAVSRALNSVEFLATGPATDRILSGLDTAARRVLDQQFRYVLNTIVFEASELMMQAKVAMLREETVNQEGANYRNFLAAKREYDAAFAASGYSMARLLAVRPELVAQYDVRGRFAARIAELVAHHQRRERHLAQQVTLNELFQSYRQVVTVTAELTVGDKQPATNPKEEVSFFMGAGIVEKAEASVIQDVLAMATQRVGDSAPVTLMPHTKYHAAQVGASISGTPLGVRYWNRFGYPAFSFVNTDRKTAYDWFPQPQDLPFMRDLSSLRGTLQVVGESVLLLAHGNGRFPQPLPIKPASYIGTVFVGGVGESMVPNYPLRNALVTNGNGGGRNASVYGQIYLFADAYGRYEAYNTPGDLAPFGGYRPTAAGYGADGRITLIRDDGERAMSTASSVTFVGAGQLREVNVVTFRATPVTILDLINPQTMQAFSGVEFVSSKSLSGFNSQHTTRNDGVTVFLAPEERFFVKLKAGAENNPQLQTTRSVVLNVDPEAPLNPLQEIEGRGYLAADYPFLLNVPLASAQSLANLNEKRLVALKRHEMADERTLEFQERATNLLAVAQQPGLSLRAALLRARDSATYSILNYPIIRDAIFDAVYGILWYLGLLVPFAFFLEKLVFGYPDIRKQLLASSLIFLVIFGLLKLLHPAFEMVRSSLMILLGFVIFLISTGVMFLLSGRFRENLEVLRRKRAQVSEAEVNTSGVIGTAFALGLNNMHRRKVRTGLTCATLVLITFAMLCFTTLHSNIVDTATAVGRAPYQGLVVKPAKFVPISEGEQFALNVRYGQEYVLAARYLLAGVETWGRETFNPDLNIVYVRPDQSSRKVNFDSILQFEPGEPLAPRIKMLTTNGWFVGREAARAKPNAAASSVIPIMVPDGLARKLGLTVEEVNAKPPTVLVNGREFVVQGIFDGATLAELRDLDGRPLLPFDIRAMTQIQRGGVDNNQVIAEDSDPLMDAQNVILAPVIAMGITVPNSDRRLTSIAIVIPEIGYKAAKEEISQYLEKTGNATYYGLDGVAYYGKRARETSLAGLLDLIIPLFIASITVLNTMRGSVYERRDEIFVYNAVGIAPRYIFFMFISEALVYSIVGTVLGYLVAQGTGSLLTALNLTGGVQLNFTSTMTIYVSLTIIAATLISTWFPAKSALEIAAPADDAGWKLPEPAGDQLRFALPFTFNHRDRVAILAFFKRYFDDHGEGSAGQFFTGPARLQLSDTHDALANEAYVPEITTTIWLKPFDLGVSQQLTIDLRTDPETREYIARITLDRLSGTREAWLRLNRTFVGKIRRHFLHWRAVGPEFRAELFTEARQLMEQELREPSTTYGK